MDGSIFNQENCGLYYRRREKRKREDKERRVSKRKRKEKREREDYIRSSEKRKRDDVRWRWGGDHHIVAPHNTQGGGQRTER
ncbi:hypothetical protein KSF_074310 [Reticulibacter mediterranei]|uniref:Uncharacterized protein n=1 Tax=Reticulibacter mediterranei TaxID=2778369 RepID=A0A8J3INR1_9CHLR|nr:hypothetical protein [Reticulibacter mediterranei]GHO97383.1 hypothetical protein KSF_074310 [Reticulibacter mediterranei]